MSTTFNRIVMLAIIVGMIFLTSMLLTQISFGSVNDSSAGYEATTTRASFDGTALTATGASPKVLSVGFGSLGSVVITGAAAGTIDLYDATTTGAHSDYTGTTTLASFPASTAAGTYTFDVAYKRGLMLVLSGTTGTSTITWKK
jgi:hypothetical protein